MEIHDEVAEKPVPKVKKEKKEKVKIKLSPTETYCIIDKTSSYIIFTESETPEHSDVEVVLPQDKDLVNVDVSTSINLAVAIAKRLQVDENFAFEQLKWLSKYIDANRNNSTCN